MSPSCNLTLKRLNQIPMLSCLHVVHPLLQEHILLCSALCGQLVRLHSSLLDRYIQEVYVVDAKGPVRKSLSMAVGTVLAAAGKDEVAKLKETK